MSESKLREESEYIKELFGFKDNETKIKNIKEMIKKSKNSPYYFINLIDVFSKYRQHSHSLSKELIDCVFSCFPEQINELQHYIKQLKPVLKIIIFPEEFPMKEIKEQKEMFSLLENDDIDGFISFLSKNPTIDITKEQKLENDGYYYQLFEWMISSISLIDLCCLFGSLKCFKYLLLNKCQITNRGFEDTLHYSIAGGNQEIINILKENRYSFENYLETSVKYHRYELTSWLHENYKCKPVFLPKCIKYYNIDAFFYFLERGHTLREIDELCCSCFHAASIIGSLPLVQFLIEKGANIEEKDDLQRTPLHIAFQHGHLSIIQYLIVKGADIEAKANDDWTSLHMACQNEHLQLVKYLFEQGVNVDPEESENASAEPICFIFNI